MKRIQKIRTELGEIVNKIMSKKGVPILAAAGKIYTCALAGQHSHEPLAAYLVVSASFDLFGAYINLAEQKGQLDLPAPVGKETRNIYSCEYNSIRDCWKALNKAFADYRTSKKEVN